MGNIKTSLSWQEWDDYIKQKTIEEEKSMDRLIAQKRHWENVRASIFLMLQYHKKNKMWNAEEYDYWREAWLKANTNISLIDKQMEVM